MPTRLPAHVRREIVRLRIEKARSLSYIAEKLELAKSTVQYVCEGLRPTREAAVRLLRMREAAKKVNAERLGRAAPQYARDYVVDEAHRQEAARRARETSLRYLERELPLRAKLVARFQQELLKEAFDGAFENVVLKACGETVVIDWALTKAATQKVPARMAVVKSTLDKRKRVAFIPRQYLRSKAAERLRKLRVQVFAVEDLMD